MKLKYVRCAIGFVVWPDTDKLSHAEMGIILKKHDIKSAGFVCFDELNATCFGRSVSLNLSSLPEDGKLLTKQMYGVGEVLSVT